MLVKSFVWERRRGKKEERKMTMKIRLFRWSVSQFPHTQMYVREYFCELLGSIILSAYLVWGLYLLWPLFGWYKSMVNSKLPLPSLNRERYRVLWYSLATTQRQPVVLLQAWSSEWCCTRSTGGWEYPGYSGPLEWLLSVPGTHPYPRVSRHI